MPNIKQKDALIVGAAALAVAVLAKPLYKRIRLSRVPTYVLKAHGVEAHISALGKRHAQLEVLHLTQDKPAIKCVAGILYYTLPAASGGQQIHACICNQLSLGSLGLITEPKYGQLRCC